MKFDDKDAKGAKSAEAETTPVIDLASFRRKKDVASELTHSGRSPLYVSHLTGKVTGTPHMQSPATPDFGDRLQRIRSSLDKINRLMTDLKRMSSENDGAAPASSSSAPQKHT